MRGRVSILPLFSPSLVTCLLEEAEDPFDQTSFSSHFVSLFARAEKLPSTAVSSGSALGKGNPVKNVMKKTKIIGSSGFNLPVWFTDMKKRYKLSERPPPRGKDIIIGHNIYSQLRTLPGTELAKI